MTLWGCGGGVLVFLSTTNVQGSNPKSGGIFYVDRVGGSLLCHNGFRGSPSTFKTSGSPLLWKACNVMCENKFSSSVINAQVIRLQKCDCKSLKRSQSVLICLFTSTSIEDHNITFNMPHLVIVPDFGHPWQTYIYSSQSSSFLADSFCCTSVCFST